MIRGFVVLSLGIVVAAQMPSGWAMNINKSGKGVVAELVTNRVDSKTVTRVMLPFPYHAIGAGEKFSYVFQGGSALLKPDSPESYMVIGVLRPCIGIVMANSENGFQLGFHKHWSNSLDSMAKKYGELETKDPSKVQVTLFSNLARSERWARFKASHQDRTQMAEIVLVRNYIRDQMGIPSDNIKIQIGNEGLMGEDGVTLLGQYEEADATLLVDKQGGLFSVSPFAENLFSLRDRKISVEEFVEFSLGLTGQPANEAASDPEFAQIREIGGFDPSELPLATQLKVFSRGFEKLSDETFRFGLMTVGLLKTIKDELPWDTTVGRSGASVYGTLPYFELKRIFTHGAVPGASRVSDSKESKKSEPQSKSSELRVDSIASGSTIAGAQMESGATAGQTTLVSGIATSAATLTKIGSVASSSAVQPEKAEKKKTNKKNKKK